MAKESEETKAPALPLSNEQLALIAQIVAASSAQSAEAVGKQIAAALIEARKPYVSPQQEENEAAAKQAMREQRERQDAEIRASQDNCPHLAGCNALSEEPSTKTSIVKHRLDHGDYIGICTNCQRIFMPTDPDYMEWMKKPCNNKPSQSGLRNFMRPEIVRDRGRAALSMPYLSDPSKKTDELAASAA